MIHIRSLTVIIILLSALFPAIRAEQHFELDVKDFTQLNIVDGINVVYTGDDASEGKASFTTTHEIADKIIFENNGKGKLTIQKTFADDEVVISEGLPTINVSSKFLKSVTNSGDSTVRVLNLRPNTEFKASVIGNGRLVVLDIDCAKFYGSIKTGHGTLVATGKCNEAIFNNTGTGSIQADNLQAVNVSARFFGTGTTGCFATGTLTVKGVMKGKLYYRDTPEKIRNYSAGVKIYSLEGIEWKGEAMKESSSMVAE